MLFGQSVFQSVLTRLKEEEKCEAEEAGASTADFRIRGLGAGFVAPSTTEHAHQGEDANFSAYFAYLPDETDTPPEPIDQTITPEDKIAEPAASPAPLPAHLTRLSETEIAGELAISDDDTETTLAEKRRRFAKHNHPDMVAPEFRRNATIRMTTANLLIDQAFRNLFWR